jgi:hypothetical protein
MTVVTAVAFDATMKTALQQFIEMYFDGGDHNIASTMVSFPVASTTFNRPLLDRPFTDDVVRINFQQLPSPAQSFNSRALIRKLDYQILSITNDPSGQLQDWASDCLGLIFSQCRDILAQSGIQVDRVGAPVSLPDTEHEFGVTQRMVRFRVVLERGAANWSETS